MILRNQRPFIFFENLKTLPILKLVPTKSLKCSYIALYS